MRGISNCISEALQRSRLATERAVGKLTLIIFGLIISAVVYAGYHILPFYYYFFELQSHMEQLIRVAAVDSDHEIRKKLLYQIRWMGIPADENQLKIDRRDNYMYISLPYQEVFYITWQGEDYDLYTFDFFAEAEGEF